MAIVDRAPPLRKLLVKSITTGNQNREQIQRHPTDAQLGAALRIEKPVATDRQLVVPERHRAIGIADIHPDPSDLAGRIDDRIVHLAADVIRNVEIAFDGQLPVKRPAFVRRPCDG